MHPGTTRSRSTPAPARAADVRQATRAAPRAPRSIAGEPRSELPLHLILAPCAALLALVVVADVRGTATVEELARDPAAVVGYPFYFGLLSHVGILLWTAAAAVAVFSALLIRPWRSQDRTARFLAAAAALTLLLAVDDLFLLHEVAAPVHLGVPEGAVIGIYVALTVVLLVQFRDVIRRTDIRVLLIALGCFGLAVGADLSVSLLEGHEQRLETLPRWVPSSYLLAEDGSKFLGIALWSTYLVSVSMDAVRGRLRG